MRILLVKMSSMGDVFHTFPALTEAQKNLPGLVVDWVVEKSFADIPAWHPLVDNVYAIELRKWRKHPIKYHAEIKRFFEEVNRTSYDIVLDAQGLLKSAWVVKKIKSGVKVGLDWSSAREPLSGWFYDKTLTVAKNQHAIQRLRQLFALSLGYEVSGDETVYGLDTQDWQILPEVEDEFGTAPYAVFLHGTTWDTKLWPEEYWVELGKKFQQAGINVVLPWGTDEEKQRSLRLASNLKSTQVWVPKQGLSINAMARILKFSQTVVSVDTGFSHVAAALDVPLVVLYRVTDPERVGALGQSVTFCESPCSKKYLKRFHSEQERLSSLEQLGVSQVWKSTCLLKGSV